ncbi:MAG: hypothetical protein OEZ65_10415 [Gemmatimonadota bacterium]|nr:hypothetical protein [Gemmatimonadota bacterium]
MTTPDRSPVPLDPDRTRSILRRASLAEVDVPRVGDLTLDELASAAAEAGMDPRSVRLASLVEDVSPPHRRPAFLGRPARHSLRIRVPAPPGAPDGAEATPSDGVGPALATALSGAGATGRIRRAGRGWRWEGRHRGRAITVTPAAPDDPRTVVLSAHDGGRLAGTWLAALAATLVGLAPLGGIGGVVGALSPLPAILLVGGVWSALARALWSRIGRSAPGDLDALAMRVVLALDAGDTRDG